jgi:DNA-binding response OmpR family regulator
LSLPPTVALVATDLVIAGAVSGALTSSGYAVRRLPPTLEPAGDAPAADAAEPAWIVLDLDARDFDAIAVAERARGRWPDARLVGIVQHVHRDRIARGRAAGLAIVPRSQVARLGSILAR